MTLDANNFAATRGSRFGRSIRAQLERVAIVTCQAQPALDWSAENPQRQHSTQVNNMKTLNLLTQSLAIGALLMSPALARAGILGSPHDFSAEAWNVKPSDQNSVCGTCHTPHHADSSVVPLWAHATTTANFTMYNSANVPVSDLQATVDPQPAGPSKACLSCHDGTVAVNQYGGAVQG